jgi:hypothetical protein
MFISPRQVPAATSLLALLTGLALSSCLYDPSQRCGPAMTYVDAANACVCNSDAVAVPGGCQPCAADEVPAGGKCGCAAGKTKNADNVCVTVAGLGDPCDPVTAPCTDATYSYCAAKSASAASTCTKACASNADCGPAYTCATWEPHPYCRTFDGLGASCGSSADCVGDAKSCDTFQTHTCGVSGCSLTANDCPRNTMCCDFSGFGTACAGACQ